MIVGIAIDSFKVALGSVAAGRAVADGIRCAMPEADCFVRPLADGGEGTVQALVELVEGRITAEWTKKGGVFALTL